MQYLKITSPTITHQDKESSNLTFKYYGRDYISVDGTLDFENAWILREGALLINEETDIGFLEVVRVIEKNDIERIFLQEIESFLSQYTQAEIDTFGLQYTEVLNYTADNQVITPFITALADSRETTRGIVAAEVISFFTAYRDLLAFNMGIKQKKFIEIDEAVTFTEINAITWTS